MYGVHSRHSPLGGDPRVCQANFCLENGSFRSPSAFSARGLLKHHPPQNLAPQSKMRKSKMSHACPWHSPPPLGGAAFLQKKPDTHALLVSNMERRGHVRVWSLPVPSLGGGRSNRGGSGQPGGGAVSVRQAGEGSLPTAVHPGGGGRHRSERCTGRRGWATPPPRTRRRWPSITGGAQRRAREWHKARDKRLAVKAWRGGSSRSPVPQQVERGFLFRLTESHAARATTSDAEGLSKQALFYGMPAQRLSGVWQMLG